MSSAVQKSSASLPVLYPCLVIGVESGAFGMLGFAFAFPLSVVVSWVRGESSLGGFERHTNTGVGVFSIVWGVFTCGVVGLL